MSCERPSKTNGNISLREKCDGSFTESTVFKVCVQDKINFLGGSNHDTDDQTQTETGYLKIATSVFCC